MSVQTRRRTAALLEVFGVYLTGAFLSDHVEPLLVHWHLISPQNPLQLLIVEQFASDRLRTELLAPSRNSRPTTSWFARVVVRRTRPWSLLAGLGRRTIPWSFAGPSTMRKSDRGVVTVLDFTYFAGSLKESGP